MRGFLVRMLPTLAGLVVAATGGIASADPVAISPGLWEITTLLRDFDLSADGQREIDKGGGRPFTERQCVTERAVKGGFHYPGESNPTISKNCKITTITETSHLVDSIVECSAYDGLSPYITHTIVIAPAPQSFTTILETTHTEPFADGRLSRSVIYVRGRWLSDHCVE